MRVLVTGHHGYIGSITVELLAEAGHAVVGLDTFFYEGCDLGVPSEAVPALRMDIRDATPSDLEGFDAVVHLAGLSNDPLGALDPQLTAEINFEATARLARTAKEAGVERFIFASSCSMYGVAGAEGAIDEQAPLRPLTEYARSKARSEEALLDLAGNGFAPILMRNATAYGVSPRLRADLVLNNLVAWGVTTGKVRILSDGTPWRPIVHVRDIAATTVALLDAPLHFVASEAFNVGRQEENYQVRDLAEIASRTVSDCVVEYGENADPDARSYRVDFGKLERTFSDLRLMWTAELGARELVDAYLDSGLTLEEFQGPRFTRLKHLRKLLDVGELDQTLRRRTPEPELAL